MTNEEAKEIIECREMIDAMSERANEALDRAIEALEQEPCEDAISREELLKAIDTWDKFGCDADTKLVPHQDHYIPYIHYDDVIKCIKSMPSVTPQEPTIKALGEELRKARKGIADEKVLIGYNLAVAICNKYLGGSEG